MIGRSISFLIASFLIGSNLACPNDQRCLKCSGSSCLKCAYGYPSTNGTCTDITTPIRGCYTYTDSSTCNECQPGYYQNYNLASKNCTKLDNSISKFCAYSWMSTTSCSICYYGVIQNGGGCFPDSTCADPYCTSCYYDPAKGMQMCSRCKEGYVMWKGSSPGVCIRVPQRTGCASLYSRSYCDECLPGYYMSNGQCLKTSSTRYGSAVALSAITSALFAHLF